MEMGMKVRSTTRSSGERGFSLIETALFMIVVALMTVAGFAFTKQRDASEHAKTSADNLKVVQASIDDFQRRNGRLPCPAPRDAAPDAGAFGKEICGNNCAVAAGNCMNAPDNGTAHFVLPPTLPPTVPAKTVRIGAVPVRALGLSDAAMLDGYGHRLVYAVTESMATPAAVGGSQPDANDGAISILDSNSNSATAVPGSVAYLVMSPGPDARGAYTLQGAQTTPCSVPSNIKGDNPVNISQGSITNPSGGSAYALLAGDNCNDDATFRNTTLRSYDSGAQSFTSTMAFRANMGAYSWYTGPWSICSSPTLVCNDLTVAGGAGTQTRAVVCHDQAGRTVADTLCAGIKPAAGPQACALPACVWNAEAFGPCAPACGASTQTSNVTCRNAADQVAPGGDAYCILPKNSTAGPKPATSKACTDFSLCTWVTGAYGACAPACGASTQTRDVACGSLPSPGVGDANCLPPINTVAGPKPAATQPCTDCTSVAAGCVNTWTPGLWGKCAPACGASTQTRITTCNNSNAVACPCTAPSPATTQACTDFTTCSYSWVKVGTGACSAPCGPGTSPDIYECHRDIDGLLSPGMCAGPAPVTTTACNLGACPAVPGVCGGAQGVPSAVAPPANLCGDGSLPAVAGLGPWTWTCLGSGGPPPGASAACGAPVAVGTCFLVETDGCVRITEINPPNSYCDSIITATYSAICTPQVQTCNDSGAPPCTGASGIICTPVAASFCATPVNGACGAASGTPANSTPTTNLCSTGTPTAVAGAGPWSWGCNGISGGTSTAANACNAPVGGATVNGICGTANGVAVAVAPSGAGLCVSGTATVVAGSGPWTWGCNGSGGGTSTAANACSAPKSGGGVCGNGICEAGETCGTCPGDCSVCAGKCMPGGPIVIGIPPCPSGHISCKPVGGPLPPGVICCSQPDACGLVDGSCANSDSAGNCPGDGVCGPANGVAVASAPSGASLCSAGTASAVTGSGPWNWTCADVNSTASCSAPKLPPICGDLLCNGTETPATCPGDCPAVAAACGATQFSCAPGTSINHTDNGITSTWTCQGSPPGPPNDAFCVMPDPAPAYSWYQAPAGVCTAGCTETHALLCQDISNPGVPVANINCKGAPPAGCVVATATCGPNACVGGSCGAPGCFEVTDTKNATAFGACVIQSTTRYSTSCTPAIMSSDYPPVCLSEGDGEVCSPAPLCMCTGAPPATCYMETDITCGASKGVSKDISYVTSCTPVANACTNGLASTTCNSVATSKCAGTCPACQPPGAVIRTLNCKCLTGPCASTAECGDSQIDDPLFGNSNWAALQAKCCSGSAHINYGAPGCACGQYAPNACQFNFLPPSCVYDTAVCD